MPEPQVLYVVTAVVVLGLVVWVASVMSRPAAKGAAKAAPASPKENKEPREKASPKGEKAAPVAPREKASVARQPAAAPAAAADAGESDDDVSGDVGPELTIDVDEDGSPTGPNALILVTAVGRTDPGLKRKHNEDAYAILEDHHLFVIADGMGRHAAGEVASQLCVEAIRESFLTSSFGEPRDPPLPVRASRLRGAILQGNARILTSSKEHDEYAGMGTTVVCAYFSPNKQRVYIAHVGDSRCYRLRAGKLLQLTTDHTLGSVGIQGKSAALLSRAVGIEEEVEVDLTMESPLPGDIYLLCSDGLSRMVQNDQIQDTLETTTNLEEATKVLIDKANQGGGRDNITAILVRVDDARLPSVRERLASNSATAG